MHIPDGFIDIPTSAAFGTLALAGTAIALKKAKATKGISMRLRLITVNGGILAVNSASQISEK